MEFYKEKTWYDFVTEKLESYCLNPKLIFSFSVDGEEREVKDMEALKLYSADVELNFDTLELVGVHKDSVFTLRYECCRWWLTVEV